MAVPPEVASLAAECAVHRVVPFIGAGASAHQLGLDWDAIGRRFADEAGVAYTGNIEAASDLVATKGRARLCELLADALLAKEFDPAKGSVHLAVMGLNLGAMYTTNQDNLIELCHARYGRPLKTVVTLDDFVSLRPGDHVLYKYHGDLNVPDSIVFCDDDYHTRGPHSSNPLDIRLRSDALGKLLLFVGYSFRDPNVRALFSHLKSTFGGKLPRSVLVQYGSDPSFVTSMADEFGVDVLTPAELYPSARDRNEALALFFRDLNNEAASLKDGAEVENLFRPSVPGSQRVALASDIEAVGAALPTKTVSEGVELFRGHFDAVLIPSEFQPAVVEFIKDLASRASDADDACAIDTMLFQLRLDGQHGLDVQAHCMTTANLLPDDDGMFGVKPRFRVRGFPEELNVVSVAAAISLLEERGAKLSKGFYDWVCRIHHGFASVDDLPDAVRGFVEAAFARHWVSSKTTYENPIHYERRLAKDPLHSRLFRPMSAKKLSDDMLNMLPKRFRVPYHTV